MSAFHTDCSRKAEQIGGCGLSAKALDKAFLASDDAKRVTYMRQVDHCGSRGDQLSVSNAAFKPPPPMVSVCNAMTEEPA